MATYSGTYTYSPSVADLITNAYGRIGIRRTEIVTQHLVDASNEANLLQVEFSNKIPNLWLNEVYDVSLVAGTATYTLPSRLIAPMDVFMTIATPGGQSTFDRIMTPISLFEYDAQPNKTLEAQPTTYLFNRLIEPTVTMWPVPDDNATYTLHMRMISQPQDATLANGVAPQVPYRWFDAFVAALAWRLSVIYAPSVEDKRKIDAERAWQIAQNNDTEMVPIYVIPGIGGYFR